MDNTFYNGSFDNSYDEESSEKKIIWKQGIQIWNLKKDMKGIVINYLHLT